MKRIFAFVFVLILAGLFAMAAKAKPVSVPTDQEAQHAHAQGRCGSLGPGTGLNDGKGWIVSMLPGLHEFRMKGPGRVGVTVAKRQAQEFDVGRPYLVVIEDDQWWSILEWRILGSEWGPVSKYFLYPLSGVVL